jgi:hypothetical protein
VGVATEAIQTGSHRGMRRLQLDGATELPLDHRSIGTTPHA